MVYESIDHGNDVTCHTVPVVLFLFFVKKINVIVKKTLQYNHACGWSFHLSFEHFMTLFLFSIRVQTMENCGCPFFFRCLYNWRQLYLWSWLLVLYLSPRGFFQSTPVFSSPQKPVIPNSNSTRNQVDGEPLCGCATPKSFFVLFIIY